MEKKWRGCKYDGRERYSTQNNNSCEVLTKGLNTCGPTSAINCYDLTHVKPVPIQRLGQGIIQPEDAFTMVMNNVNAYRTQMIQARSNLEPGAYPSNEIPQYYPFFAKLCFNARVEFREGSSVNTFKQIFERFPGSTIMALLKTPNHFVCLKGFHEGDNFFLGNDPWDGRDGVPGFDRKFFFSELDSNLQFCWLHWYPEEFDY